MPDDAWKYGAGAIGGWVLNEVFTVGPRVRLAEQRGYNAGWVNRDAELRPTIAWLQAERTRLTAGLNEAVARLAALERENASLRGSLPGARRKALAGTR